MDPPILWLDEVGSTNDEARRLHESGQTGPLWVCARRQTAGRGRRGNAWTTLEGNLFATGLFTLRAKPAQAANLSFVAALAVADVLSHWIAPGRIGLKWPNDVLVGGAKISGILLESWTVPGGALGLAVGIGINLRHHPGLSDRKTTCVADEATGNPQDLDRETAAGRLAASFAAWFAVWRDEGFAPVRAAWLDRALGLGGPIVANLPGESVRGMFAGLSEDGALLLDPGDGRLREISAGEVFLPG